MRDKKYSSKIGLVLQYRRYDVYVQVSIKFIDDQKSKLEEFHFLTASFCVHFSNLPIFSAPENDALFCY